LSAYYHPAHARQALSEMANCQMLGVELQRNELHPQKLTSLLQADVLTSVNG
jgi:hypothetical protein